MKFSLVRLLTCLLVFFISARAFALVAAVPDPAANINSVTLRLAAEMVKTQKDTADNLVVSPYNVMTALALAGSGAAGGTQAEFRNVVFAASPLDFSSGAAQLMRFNDGLLKNAAGKVNLLTANGIWVNKNLAALKPDFADNVQKIFGANISAENFENPATADAINHWAGDNTKGLISKIVDKLDNSQAVVLASALYFKGAWAQKFDKALTQQAPFTADDGSTSQQPMMHRHFGPHEGLRYLEGDDFEAGTLDYGAAGENGAAMRLIVIRPKQPGQSARQWLAAQNPLQAPWLDPGQYRTVAGDIALPHIDIHQHHDLIPALKNLGLQTAFTPQADFSPMVEGTSVFISKVSHDIVFKTDEEGSEAAAVTTIMMAPSAAMIQPETVNLVFDRSFVFALQDAGSGALLFIGAVNKPESKL